MEEYFDRFGLFLVGSVFVVVAIAALFFGFSVRVAPWQHFASVGLVALGVVTVKFVWKRALGRLRS
ncbi:hypothetical protein [Thermomonospora echinospora]|nr:hypothetical protein [Thermomonospora echinospora]